jgi:hypothetical protein
MVASGGERSLCMRFQNRDTDLLYSYQFKDKRSVPIDEIWTHVLLSAIGETLENEDDGEVMGVVVNVRKGFYR